MIFYYITSRSLTGAQRILGVLRRAGVNAALVRLSGDMTGGGCGSGVRINERELERALTILHRASMDGVRVFVRYEDGSSRELDEW